MTIALGELPSWDNNLHWWAHSSHPESKLHPDDARRALSHRCVEIAVTDLGLRLRLELRSRGFIVAAPSSPVALRIAAAAPAYWRLLRGQDDADRLFFERALQMEGDTEYGLVLKNTLDALGPLLPV